MARILDIENIGSFKTVEKIGEGGMAIIYKAIQPSLKRTVVIKKLKDPNNEIIQRFKKEAFVSASFSQENVLSIYDFIYHGRSYYLVMEYVDGFDLHDIFDYMAPLSPTIAALIIREVAKGLEYTHSKNIIHRDIKPSNILISREGDVKLIDFGVAKDEAPSKLTLTGMIVGTPSYMSPEQANGEKITSQSDIYSLGVLLYEIITGFKPFTGDTNTVVFSNISKGKFSSPQKFRSDLPYRIIKIIKKCMRKDRAKRYQTATELIRDLDRFLSWQILSDKKEILSKFIRQYEKIEQTTTIHTQQFHSNKNRAEKYAIAAIIFLFLFSTFQLHRFFNNERFSELFLQTNSSDFSVFIDNKYIGESNTREKLFTHILPGHHELIVKGSKKYGTYVSGFDIKPAGMLKKTIFLPEINANTILNFDSEPEGADIYLDGHFIGKTPLLNFHIQFGKHNIRIEKAGYLPFIVQKSFENSQSYAIQNKLKPQPNQVQYIE